VPHDVDAEHAVCAGAFAVRAIHPHRQR
jgi:hypothetical protein